MRKIIIFLLIGSIIVSIVLLVFHFRERKREQQYTEYVKQKSKLEDEKWTTQQLKNELIQQMVSLSSKSVSRNDFSIEIKNNIDVPIRHLEFRASLMNAFGEALGYGPSGGGKFRYESINASELVRSGEIIEIYFKTNGIEDYYKFYNSHKNNLKIKFSLEYIKLDNGEEYKVDYNFQTFFNSRIEVYENLLKRELEDV